MRPRTFLPFLMALLSAAAPGTGQSKPPDLTETSLEQLMNIEVTSVGKKEDTLFQSAAAVYVITSEEIARSGLTSIPEILRLVPGLSVARINASSWAITSRGFSGRFANMMLVLLDGRTLYAPHFSGVFWDKHDLLVEDIDRIEVIRGPGGTMWGANAVNGVINIITKRAAATQGGLLTAEFGSEEIIGGLRQGGKLGSTHYRVYGKYARRTPQALPSGRDAFDRWHLATSGFRIDATPSAKDDLTLQGDFYGGRLAEIDSSPVLGPPYARSTQGRVQEAGANVLGRWKHKLASGSETSLQMYFDRPPRSATDLHTVDTTADLEFQHHLQAGRRHDAVWGLGYRYIWSHSKGPFDIYLQPAARQRQVLNAFVQDEVSLIPNRLEVTFGGKLEHNDYTGFEFQPSVRLWWTPTRQQAWWAAWSRAVRTPSRFDTDAVINVAVFPGPPGGLNVISIRGNPDKKSEVLHAYELGYRARPSRNLYLDVTGFVHRYDHLTTVEPAAPFLERTPAPAHLVLPQRFDNLAQGRTFGAELAAGWSMTPQWRWNATYTWLGFDLRLKPASRAAEIDDPGRSPKHQFRVAGEVNLPRRFWWDYSMYFVSRLAAVPAYARLDTGVTRRFGEYLEVSLRGQNLAEGRHLEFADPEQTIAPTEIRRSVYGKVTWRF